MNHSASKVPHAGLVQGLCGLFIMAFIYVVPLLDSPPCPRMSLSFRLCSVTLRCSLLSSGKIILTLSNPARLIGDRGGMNKGSKERFFPPAVRLYLLWVPVARHNATQQLHAAGFFRFVGPGPLHLVPLLKPNHLVHMFSRLSKYKRVYPRKI